MYKYIYLILFLHLKTYKHIFLKLFNINSNNNLVSNFLKLSSTLIIDLSIKL